MKKKLLAASVAVLAISATGAMAQSNLTAISNAAAQAAANSSSSASVTVNVDTGCQEVQAGLAALGTAGIGIGKLDSATALFDNCEWLKGWGLVTMSNGDIFLIEREDMRAYNAGETIVLANGQSVALPPPAPTWREYVAGLPAYQGAWDSFSQQQQEKIRDCAAKWKGPGDWSAQPVAGCRANFREFFAGS